MAYLHPRRTDMNVGLIVRDLPDDRHIVGALVVLMDDNGDFSVVPHAETAKFGWPTSPPPSDETLWDLVATIRTAWQIASLRTEGSNE